MAKDLVFQVLELSYANDSIVPLLPKNEIDRVFPGDFVQYYNVEDNDEKEKKLFRSDRDATQARFTLRLYGRTNAGESVCLVVPNFYVLFSISVPEQFTEQDLELLRSYIDRRLSNANKQNRRHPGQVVYEEGAWALFRGRDYYGFQGAQDSQFARLAFYTEEAAQCASYLFGYPLEIYDLCGGNPVKFNVYETKIDPILRFIHARNIEPCSYISVPIRKSIVIKTGPGAEYTDLTIYSSWHRVNPYPGNLSTAPFVQASFDIECNSHDFSFPKASDPENCVTMIATAFKRFGEPDFFLRHVVTLGQCGPLQAGIEVDSVETEQELLIKWAELLRKQDPDILYSYNGDGFDCRYMYDRAKLHGEAFMTKWLQKLGRLRKSSATLNENGETFSSSAYGSRTFYRLRIPGRVNFDILTWILRSCKLESYKLDSVAEKYLGMNKHDVTPREIFELFQTGTPQNIARVAAYCIQDTVLPQLLVDKLSIFVSQLEMARVTYVPFRYLFEAGQGVKVISQIFKKARELGYVIPTIKTSYNTEEPEDNSFQGATVLEPEVGAYYDSCVAVLDFASLYPSIIRANLLDYCTIVLNDKYLALPGYKYKVHSWDETSTVDAEDGFTGKKIKQQVSKRHNYTFVTHKPNGEPADTVLSQLLADLYSNRKAVKKQMGNVDPKSFEYQLLDGRQLALKVSMNSMYGFLAAPKLRCTPIAATVTYIGRTMINSTKEWIETRFEPFARSTGLVSPERPLKARVIYGDTDSVFCIFETDARGKASVDESFVFAEKAAAEITKDLFTPPVQLEFEKVFWPLVMIRKKRYVGDKYEGSPDKPPQRAFKGIELERRDNFVLTKTMYSKLIDIAIAAKYITLDETQSLKALMQKQVSDYVTSMLGKMIRGEMDISNFVVSKSLKDSYATTNIPHVFLAHKIAKRDPGSEPKSGDRVRYVITTDPENPMKPKTPAYQRAEVPEEIDKLGLKLDVLHYLALLETPLSSFLNVLGVSTQDIFSAARQEYRFLRETDARRSFIQRMMKPKLKN